MSLDRVVKFVVLIFFRYGKPMSVDDMLDGMNGYEENPVYELRKRAGGPDTEHFARSKIFMVQK